MEIQTFEIEEKVGGTTPEIEAEARGLIEKMGLEGQKELVDPSKPEGERFQYPEMTRSDKVVYEVIFPAKTKIEDYSAGIIPVRVLQVAAHAREFCEQITVWHKSVRDPDPLLVGRRGAEHAGKLYLLARWGDALKDFSELVKEARGLLIVKFTAQIKENISRNQGDLTRVDSLVEQHLAGEWVHIH